MSASTKALANEFVVAGEPETALPSKLARAGFAVRRWADRTFPDRQILIRGPGNVAALRASQRAQLLGAGAACALLVALGITSAGLVVAWRAEARAAHDAARLYQSLAAAQEAAVRAQAQYQAAARARDLAVAQADITRDIAVAQAERARDAAVAQARQARDAAIARANQLSASNNAALNGLIQQTQSTVGQVEAVIKSTGLNPDRLANEAGAPAAAPLMSPNIPAAVLVTPGGVPNRAGAQAALLVGELARLRALGAVLAQIPLSSPTAQAIVSSGFGMRADPFTGAPEFHVGIDLPGPIGAPIYATAPGIVTFAGPSTGYGNLITIDHGYGLSTRYSHLDKILVKAGAAVTLHQEIGLMGNTGWSTGPHLLYETRVDGQPRNPAHFIKVNPYDVQN